jgi:hypothetical protein
MKMSKGKRRDIETALRAARDAQHHFWDMLAGEEYSLSPAEVESV